MRPFCLAALALVASALLAPGQNDKTRDPDLVAALKGHKEAVYSVAFTPDGKQILTASGEPAVRLFDLATAKELKSFGGPLGHKQLVLALALSPDGTQFATAGADNSAKTWDFPTNKHQREFALADESRAVAVSPDNAKLACGTKDGKLRVYNVADGKQVYEVAAHAGAVTGLSYNGNGTLIASAGADGMLKYWNAADGKATAGFGAHPGEITGLHHSPNSTTAYTCGKDGTVRYWGPPVATRTLAAALASPVSALSLSPDGAQAVVGADKLVRVAALANGATTKEFVAPGLVTNTAYHPNGSLVAATVDRRLLVWQTKDGALLTTSFAHAGDATSATFNAGGNVLATAGKDGFVRLWAMPPLPTRAVAEANVVRVAAVSPDGKRLATGGNDKAIRLYKLDNLKAVERQITGPTGPANAVAFSADNVGMASAGDDGVIRFWNLTKGEQTGLIGGHTGPVTGVAYFGTTQVVTSSADGGVKMWTIPAPAAKNNFAHAGVVTSAALSPDGSKLLTGCDDKQVRSWNLASGLAERTWTGPTLAVTCVAFAPNGALVAAGSADKSVTVWQANDQKEVKKFANLPSAVQCVALTADNKLAVAGLADGSVKLLDVATGKEANAIAGHKGAVNSLSLTPKGDLIYGGEEGTVLVRNPAAKEAAVTWKHGAAIRAIALTKDGTKAAVGGAGKDVKVYEAATGKPAATIATPAEVRGLSYSADGKKLAIAGVDGKTRIYSTADGSLEEYFAQEGPINAVAFAADGKRVLSAGSDKSARVWALSLVWQAKHEGAVKRVVVSPRGDRILSAGADGVVRVWAVADGKAVQSIRAHSGAIAGLAVSADAARIVTAGADKTARVWDWAKLPPNAVAGKDVEKSLAQTALPGPAESVALTADGKRLAVGVSGGKDRVLVIDPATGQELATFGDPEGLAARNLAFLADGRTLLSSGEDKAVSLTDVNVVGAIHAHAGGASGVAFHNNGTQILTAGADKTAKLWALATGKLDKTFGPLAEPVSAAGFSRDYTQVALTSGKALKAFAVADGKEVVSIDMPAAATSVSFSADKTRVATSNGDGKARVWDVATKTEAQSFVHGAAVTGVAFHPSTPTTLVSGGADKVVGIHTLSLTRVLAAGSPLNALCPTPNQQYVLTAAADGKVTFWNLSNGVADRTYQGYAKGATGVAVSRSSLLVAVGGADDKVRVVNFVDAKQLSEFKSPAASRALAFSPDNKALIAGGTDGSLTTYDVTYQQGQPTPAEFGNVLQSSAHGAAAFDVSFPLLGATYYTAGADKTVKQWKVASDSPTRNLAHPQAVNCVAFNKEGTVLLTGAADGKLRMWDMAKGTVTREVTAHVVPNNTAIYAVVYSPDEKTVATASIDGSAKLWNVADGKLVREMKAYKDKEFPKGHQEAVLSVAWSPDGKTLATGSMDRTIKLWNVADGSVIREFANPAFKPEVKGATWASHPGWIYGLRFVSGGKKLVSAGQAPRLKGYLATWDPATGKLLSGKELAYGSIFALALSPDEKRIALATGGSVRSGEELNLGVVLKTPE